METTMPGTTTALRDLFTRLLAVLALACAGATVFAQTVDPPGRVAVLTEIEGVTLFARAADTGWIDAVRNRPITNGDRLRTQDGRAELHLGTATLHLDSGTTLEVVALDQQAAHIAVMEGSVNARVRELVAGENFEINTPQLALRAAEPGEWRVDIDKVGGYTRVTVKSGAAVLYGESGTARRLQAGQQMVFIGRELTPLAGVPAPLSDAFDLWADDRNRAQDDSLAARHLPREVVGYPELDRYGTWSQDPAYGTVWYPQLTVTNWAPYRYGRWEWIAPWGWTWIDDAPWGFAPFHYGRWATIGSRWAWVPGPLGPRPVYAPALVAFVGGEGWSMAVRSGPGVGWYPLAPGEVWQPFFRASAVYVHNVNRYVVPAPGHRDGEHFFQRRPEAVTALPVNDFHRGVPVGHRWARISSSDAARAQPFVPPPPAPSSGARPGNDRDRPGMRVVPPAQPDSRAREQQRPPRSRDGQQSLQIRPVERVRSDPSPRPPQQSQQATSTPHEQTRPVEVRPRSVPAVQRATQALQERLRAEQPAQRPSAQPNARPQRHDERGPEGHKVKESVGGPERKSGAISSGSWRANG
jgi:hypothetical protein